MKINPLIKVYGDITYRGKCPLESAEQATFFNRIRTAYPKTYGRTALHAKNEGKRTMYQAARDKSQGLATGTPDIMIPGRQTFCCELKRRDHTKSNLGEDQEAYLLAAQHAGAFVCVALGVDAAWDAFIKWSKTHE